MQAGDLNTASHAFNDDALVPAGMYVILFTGCGQARWGKTKEGAHVYHAYMNRSQTVWSCCEMPIHILHTQHSYSERTEALLMR